MLSFLRTNTMRKLWRNIQRFFRNKWTRRNQPGMICTWWWIYSKTSPAIFNTARRQRSSTLAIASPLHTPAPGFTTPRRKIQADCTSTWALNLTLTQIWCHGSVIHIAYWTTWETWAAFSMPYTSFAAHYCLQCRHLHFKRPCCLHSSDSKKLIRRLRQWKPIIQQT